MPIDRYPSVSADAPHGTVTLGELRELVDVATGLPPETIVRANAIPFKVSDLGNRKGACVASISLDQPENR